MNDGCSHSVFFSVDKEKTEELLRAIQRKTVTLDTLRYNPLPLCRSPAALLTGESQTDTPEIWLKQNFKLGKHSTNPSCCF